MVYAACNLLRGGGPFRAVTRPSLQVARSREGMLPRGAGDRAFELVLNELRTRSELRTTGQAPCTNRQRQAPGSSTMSDGGSLSWASPVQVWIARSLASMGHARSGVARRRDSGRLAHLRFTIPRTLFMICGGALLRTIGIADLWVVLRRSPAHIMNAMGSALRVLQRQFRRRRRAVHARRGD
jgi:hypothetical protein